MSSWGHPNFRAGKRTFAALEVYEGQLSVCFKPDPDSYRRIVKDPRFFVPPYVGQQGWLSLKVDAALEGLLEQSYRGAALVRMLAALDGQPRPAAPPPRERRPALKP